LSSPSKILIAPLDWGLGHTTRCLPIIDLLLREGHSVTLAAPQKILDFVATTFPEIRKLHLAGYQIEYSKNRAFFTGKIIFQIPKILRAIHQEHQWLRQLVVEEHFNLIISDNRYGLHHTALPCIIMTHQLMIKSGWGKLIDRQLQRLHYRLLKQFKACWVVDESGENNLSGELAHPQQRPANAEYIGILSQMTLFPLVEDFLEKQKSTPEILVLLSGPEPMRSQLEATLLPQCEALKNLYHFNFVAGNIHQQVKNFSDNSGFHYFSKRSAKELAPLLHSADLVICRSGYSTLMDLAALGKKALLIPTPGQTEQEYLAQHLNQKYNTVFVKQSKISLDKDIPLALAQKAFALPAATATTLKKAINKVMH